MKPDLIILFSGGADSVWMLERALRSGHKPYCVLVDYDQNHKIELEFAKRYLNEKSVPSQIVKLHGLGLRSGLTTGEKSLYDDVHEMYVPSRNLMFVSIAASIAENLNISVIWYGANFSDNAFPDCRVEWVSGMNYVLNINGSSSIDLVAPALWTSKEDIIKDLEAMNIDMDKIFSGYLEDNKYKVSLDFIGDKRLPKINVSGMLEEEEIEPGLWSRFKT